MRQYVLCNGCSSQIPVPNASAEEPCSRFIHCENCGQEFFWDAGLTENQEPLLLFPVSDPTEHDQIASQPLEFSDIASDSNLGLELELESEPESEPGESAEMPDETVGQAAIVLPEKTPDWSVLGAAAPLRRRKEASAIRKIVPPILGGLAAFPIATMIMWYGFGRDIGSTGPTVAQYVPWIVPERLRDQPRDFTRREARSTPTQPKRLPTVNRPTLEESMAQGSSPIKQLDEERVSVGPDLSQEVGTQTLKVQSPDEETFDESQFLSQTIAKLQALQEDWGSTPKDNRAMQVMMIGRYCTEIKRLAQQSSELKGRSGAVWWKEIDSLARGIMAHPNLPIVIQHSATGKWPDVPASLPNEFVATIVKISEGNAPISDASWMLNEKWRYGDKEMKIEVQPGAWHRGNGSLSESNSLVFGKLVTDDEGTFTLKAHAIILP